ncbi:RDD family protein [Chitinophaga sp. Cy-1792]|uniref:RDD family protein n=1 Tax=Chitinophaga sp. Cy-1792 TaxID=2608339 RepID=UPI00141EDDCC|nr:RDD family protein [Chitinophaga sp. Cy-1792]
MNTIKIPTSFNIDLEFEAADIGLRFIAWLIDLVVRAIFVWIFYTMFGTFDMTDGAFSAVTLLFVTLPALLYPLLFELFMNGQTPGKKVMQIKVVGLIGNTPSTSQLLTRWFFRIIEQPFFFFAVIPVISIVRSPLKQRVGDIAAGTIVISTKQKGKIEDTIFRNINYEGYTPSFPEIMRLSDRDMNKIKELLDRALSGDDMLASRVANRVKDVLKISSNLPDTMFLETVLNDYNYYTTFEK